MSKGKKDGISPTEYGARRLEEVMDTLVDLSKQNPLPPTLAVEVCRVQVEMAKAAALLEIAAALRERNDAPAYGDV